MSAYSQPGAKRQKRDGRADAADCFQGIDKIEYNNMAAPTETTSYRYFNSTERIHSRPMEEWLKLSVSLTEFRSNGSDIHGKPAYTRPWDDGTNTMDNYKRCIKALFDFCTRLGIKYWTAFDTDLIPSTDSWDENKAFWDDIVEYIQEVAQRCHVKLLWVAPDLHSHPRYACGSFTSHDASTFIQAATQIKRCLEISHRLNAECFLLWPYREGYDSFYHTDVNREIKLFAKLMKLTAEYKDRLNYSEMGGRPCKHRESKVDAFGSAETGLAMSERGLYPAVGYYRSQLLVMPYYNCNYSRNYSSNHCSSWQHSQLREHEMVNMYMWDVTSCLYFLKNYNLDRHYKVCTPPGHHMFMANVYNMMGGVFITNDVDQYDSKRLTLMMKCIVDQGSPLTAGISLKLTPRRDSDLRDLTTLYMKYIDAIAKGLRFACTLIAEQVFSKHIQQRYATYYSGFGSRLVSSDVSMEECEEYYKKNQHPHGEVTSSKSEHLDLVFQRYLDTCDHI